MDYSGKEREEVSSLDGFAGCEGERAQGSSVEGTNEGYETVFPGVPLREFDSGFYCFGSAISEVCLLVEPSRGYRGECFC